MNISQSQSILNSIENILSFDFDQFVADNNPSGNLDEIKFGEFPVAEFKNTYLKVFNQLKAELEKGLGLILPNQEVFQNEYNSVTLDVESSNFHSHLINFVNRNAAAEILRRFVYYQIRLGFWNASMVNSHSVDLVALQNAQQKLDLMTVNLEEKTKVFDSLKSAFEKQIGDLTQILEERGIEGAKFTELFENADADGAAINALLTNVKTNEATVTGSTENVKILIDGINTDIEKYQEEFTAFDGNYQSFKAELDTYKNETVDSNKRSKEAYDFIISKKEDIVRLTGMAADGSLGSKFDIRKNELGKGVDKFWRWAVPVSIVLALGWVLAVFTLLSAHLGNDWINLLINLFKTTPAWFLVGFVFSQYTKERDLQEEYAFKSAVAMTLTAYSQMLAENDGGESTAKASKQEMLLKSIEKIYTQPELRTERGGKNSLKNSKPLIEALNAVSEVVKNIKG
jgi:hypothetical protein